MVAVKIATLVSLLQLASASVIPREEPKHYPTFGLRIIAEGTKYHNKFIHLGASVHSPLQIAIIPEGEGHSIDAEFFVREDGHLCYGQPGSAPAYPYVLGFDPEQPSWSGIAEAYFLPSNTPKVEIKPSGTVLASAGGKDVVAFDGLELKVKGERRWQVCPGSNGVDKNGKKIIIHQLVYDGARGSPEWVGRDSAADRCTDVIVKKQDLV